MSRCVSCELLSAVFCSACLLGQIHAAEERERERIIQHLTVSALLDDELRAKLLKVLNGW